MSNIVHQPCPYEACGSSDAFSWEPELQVGSCHSCSRSYPMAGMRDLQIFDWVADDYPLKERKPPVTQREIASGTYDGIRGIDPDVCQLYGIQLQLDAAGDPVRYAFKWPTNVKYRGYEEKQFWLKDKGGLDDLFGPDFNKGSSNRLYITEGEFDAASLYQILGKTFPVKSLPSATMSERFLKKNYEYINSFKEVVYAGEQDAPGKAAAEKLYELFPEKFFYVPMSKHKDANEFLMAGDSDDLMWSARKPQRFSPDNFYLGDLDIETTIKTENPYSYVPTGHSGLDDKIRGLVKGGITFVKAPRGGGKCLSPDQLVLKYDGSTVKAKDVVKGDLLLGPDSRPRTVLSTTTGVEEMFKVVPVKGDPWFCNRSHILATFNYEKGYTNISVDNYLKLSEGSQGRYVQYRTEEVSFGQTDQAGVPYDPYFLGAYLGDGSKHNNCITLGDSKSGMVPAVYSFAKDQGWGISLETMKGCVGYHFTSKGDFKKLKNMIFEGDTRLIPSSYKTGTVSTRRSLLAGLLDADAYLHHGFFEIVQKSEQLADDIAFVARSLGYAAYKKKVTKGIKSTGFVGTYFQVNISGDFTDLPLLRHKVKPRRRIKSVLRTNFHLESQGEGDYCGFELDGDKLFVLGDFTVTHNTEMVRFFECGLLKSDPAVKIAMMHMEEQRSTTYRSMATYELGINVRTKEDAASNKVSEDEVIKAAQKIADDRTVVFELRSHDDPMKVLDYVRMAAVVYGVDYVFIDHVQRLAYLSQGGADGATSLLTAVGSRMAQLAKELDIGVIFISQVNDDGRTKYAGSLEEEAIICIKLERDVESEDEDVRNTTNFVVDKNRPFSRLGKAGSIFYDADTTVLKEENFNE